MTQSLTLPMPPGDVLFVGAAERFNVAMRQILRLGSGVADVIVTNSPSALVVVLVPNIVIFFNRRSDGAVDVHPIVVADPTTLPGRLANDWAQRAIDLTNDFLLEVRPTPQTVQ
jgi:hypothetical protein